MAFAKLLKAMQENDIKAEDLDDYDVIFVGREADKSELVRLKEYVEERIRDESNDR